MADGVSRSDGIVMHKGRRVGRGEAWHVAAKRLWASSAAGRMSSFAGEGIGRGPAGIPGNSAPIAREVGCSVVNESGQAPGILSSVLSRATVSEFG